MKKLKSAKMYVDPEFKKQLRLEQIKLGFPSLIDYTRHKAKENGNETKSNKKKRYHFGF